MVNSCVMWELFGMLCCKNLHYVLRIGDNKMPCDILVFFCFFFFPFISERPRPPCLFNVLQNWNVVHLVPYTFHQLTWTSAQNRKRLDSFIFLLFCMYFLYTISPQYPLFKFYIKPIPGQSPMCLLWFVLSSPNCKLLRFNALGIVRFFSVI